MSLPPPPPPVGVGGQDEGLPRWGLGDVALGIAASLFLSVVVGSLIITVFGWQPGGSGGDADGAIPVWGLALLQVPLWAGYLGVTLWATATKGAGAVHDLGVRTRWFDAPLGLFLGLITQVALLPLLYVPIFWLTGTDSDELSEPARELAGRAGSPPTWLLFAFLVGVCAPVVEELFYRGLLLRSLTKRGWHPALAVAVSSAVFAAIHFQLLQFAGLFVFGIVAGVLATLTGRLGASIWAHVGFNMTTVVLLYRAT